MHNKTTIHQPANREDWLNLRLNDVTASEVASLFNTGYMSRYELWHTKANKIVANLDSERMRWGRRLERAIADGICEDEGIKLVDKPVEYYSNSEWRMGATPDFIIDCPRRGRGILQIKNVDSLIFNQKWGRPEDNGEAPDFIEMQVQQEMLLTGCEWGLIGALVGGNKGYVYERKLYPQVAESLIKHVADFWKSIEENKPPEPDFKRDAEFIAEMYSYVTSGKTADMTGDHRVEELMVAYNEWSAKEKEATELKQSYKSELLTLIGDAESVTSSVGKISAKEVKGSDGTLITPEMVGQYYGGRKGYRSFRVTINKE